MTPPDPDLSASRRAILLARIVRWAMLVTVFAASTLMWIDPPVRTVGSVLLIATLLAYVGFWVYSMRAARRVAQAPELVAAGELDAASNLLSSTLRSLTLFPVQKQVDLYHLAVLRQAQQRSANVAEITAAVLSSRHAGPVEVAARLLRLEALLDLGDLRGAHVELLRIWNAPLPLSESARLLFSATRYEMAVAAWGHALSSLPGKLKLADTLASEPFAQLHVMFARAAYYERQPELAAWLLARARAVTVPDALPPLRQLAPELFGPVPG